MKSGLASLRACALGNARQLLVPAPAHRRLLAPTGISSRHGTTQLAGGAPALGAAAAPRPGRSGARGAWWVAGACPPFDSVHVWCERACGALLSPTCRPHRRSPGPHAAAPACVTSARLAILCLRRDCLGGLRRPAGLRRRRPHLRLGLPGRVPGRCCCKAGRLPGRPRGRVRDAGGGGRGGWVRRW